MQQVEETISMQVCFKESMLCNLSKGDMLAAPFCTFLKKKKNLSPFSD